MSSELEQWIVWYTREPSKVAEYVLVQALSVSHAEQQFWAAAHGNMFTTRIIGISLSKHSYLYAYSNPITSATAGLVSVKEAEKLWNW